MLVGFLVMQINTDAVVPKAHSRKKVVAPANRCECVYKRTDEPSVHFYEKGAATEHTKNDHLKSGHFDCSEVRCDVAPPTGIEPMTNP